MNKRQGTYGEESLVRRRALTRDLDGLAVGACDTIAVACAYRAELVKTYFGAQAQNRLTIGVGTRLNPKGRNKGRINVTLDAREGCRRSSDSKRQRAESTREDHLNRSEGTNNVVLDFVAKKNNQC